MTQIQDLMQEIGVQAKAASRILAKASATLKSEALTTAAKTLDASRAEILAANEKDLQNGQAKNLSAAMMDRLRLDEGRIDGIIKGVESIAALAEPVGKVLAQWQRPNGLDIQRVSTPLGVIGVIYESRPNVTADAGALCLKSGNAVILRGGSDSFFSSTAIHSAMQKGIVSAGLPAESIQLVPSVDREAVGMILAGLNGNVDVVVPRGGKGLVERVQSESRVPVFAHLEGICHIYIDESADQKIACDVALNSKMRRTGICGAVETLLVEKNWAAKNLATLLDSMDGAGCEIRGDKAVCEMYSAAKPAVEDDWTTEYLAAIISVKLVAGVDEAIEHINQFGSHHTESIITADETNASRFLSEIDSAILLHNASTQFADGGEFGMGAEIGIATGKMHARGPVGVEQLCSFNYRVRGNGQTRP